MVLLLGHLPLEITEEDIHQLALYTTILSITLYPCEILSTFQSSRKGVLAEKQTRPATLAR